MKKTLLFGVVVLLGIALAFTACQQPTDYSMSTKLNEIPGPSGLQVTAYEGVNILTWNVVPNASNYRVIRRDTVTGENVQRVASSPNLMYADIVAWDNQMINERDYEYTVISLNTLSPTGHQAASDTTVILQGESKAGVQAKIPESLTVDIAALEVKVSKYKNTDGSDRVAVNFKNEPNFKYEVAYTYGKEASQAIVRTFTGNENATLVGNQLAPSRAINFPMIGGDNTISVRAWFAGGSDYYSQTSVKTVQANYTLVPALPAFPVAGQPGAFSATEQENKSVVFTWGNIVGATGYKIYKATVNKNINDAWSTTGVIVSSDWTAVTLEGLDRTATGWQARETGATVSLTDFYYYVIIAEGANDAKSPPAFTTAVALSSTYAGVTTANFGLTVIGKQVQLIWPADVDATYELTFAEVESATGNANAADNDFILVAGASYQTIAITAADYVEGRGVKLHTPPSIGKNYAYKLVSKKNGLTSINPAVKVAASGAYSATSPFTIARYVLGTNPVPALDNAIPANSVRLILSGTRIEGVDYGFKLFRKEATAPQSAYVELNLGSLNELKAATAQASWIFIDNGLDVTKRYSYKLVTTGYKQQMPTANGTPVAGEVLQINPYGYDSVSFTGLTTGVVNPAAVALGNASLPAGSLQISGSNIANMPISVRYTTATGTAEASITIIQVADTTPVAPAPANYYYYGMLPSNAISGNLSIRYAQNGNTAEQMGWTYVGTYTK